MHTKDVLADALLAIGLMDMSVKARGGYYHDFLSPLDAPARNRPVIWVKKEAEYFCRGGWTTQISATVISEMRERICGKRSASSESYY